MPESDAFFSRHRQEQAELSRPAELAGDAFAVAIRALRHIPGDIGNPDLTPAG
jgi:hypothetical protein